MFPAPLCPHHGHHHPTTAFAALSAMSFRCLCACAVLMVLQGSVCGNKFDVLHARATESRKRWVAIPTASPAATNRGTSWACTLGDKMYMFGGLSSPPQEVLLDDFWAFDFATLEFSEIVNLTSVRPPPREKHKLVCDEKRGFVYLVSGKNVEDLWIFDVKQGSWRMVPHDPVNGLSIAIFSSDFVPMSTTDQIVIAGTDGGEFADYLRFDKDAEVWLPRAYDSRLQVEDPGAVGFGDLAVLMGGSRVRNSLSPNTFKLNASDPSASWELVTDTLPGEEFKMVWLYNSTVGLMGDPGGKGSLADGNGIAQLDLSHPDADWVTVDKSDDWIPGVSDFMTARYKGNMIVVGGVSSTSQGSATPNTNLYVYNPRMCINGCNGNGRCELGNCVDCVGHSGIACEIPDPVSTDYTPIIAGVSVGAGVFFFIFAFVTWKATAKYRAFRRLYATSSVAENMAEQIACMELEKLDYLNKLEHPTSVQASFITIVSTLKTYRMYLPESVLQKVSRAADDDTTVDLEGSQSGQLDKNSTSRRGIALSVSVTTRDLDLAAKVARKRVGTATFELGRYGKWVAERGAKGDTAAIYASVATFADAVQSTVARKGGTILEAQLGSGRIICAWNFQIPKYSPDVAAVSASLEIMDATRTTLPLPLHVAVTTGSAWVGNLGGSNLRVPVLVGHHQCISDILMKSAMARQVSMTTNCESLQDHFKLVPIDIVSPAYNSKSGASYQLDPEQAPSVWVFKVLGAATKGQEWMYDLDEARKDGAGLLSVMRMFDEKGAETANDLLTKLSEGMSDAKRAQARLLAESLSGTIPATLSHEGTAVYKSNLATSSAPAGKAPSKPGQPDSVDDAGRVVTEA